MDKTSLTSIIIGILVSVSLILSTWKSVRDKLYPRYWKLCAALLWIGLLCIAMAMARETMDEKGFLRESAFLPIGWGIVVIGILGVFLRIVLDLYNRSDL